MKIVADENIPLLEYYFTLVGDLVLKPGRTITREDLLDADILLVRSITQVNQELLHDTPVKFVGSATTGFDHIDTHYLEQAGIRWATAAGCNTVAVAEYVICVIAALQNQGFLLEKNRRVGVVGVGSIGKQVVDKLKIVGFEVVQCDPPRAQQEQNFSSTSLENFTDLDFVTLHTPLTYKGDYSTFHLIEKNFLKRQKADCIILNAGRGSVINFSDLKRYGKHLRWCLDVWEHEPQVDHEILKSTAIATPHIAGYSVQSKYRGVEMIYQAALQQNIISDNNIPQIQFPTKTISLKKLSANWRDVVLEIYNPMSTSQQMKDNLLQSKETFDNLRKNFVERYEFGYVDLFDAGLSNEDRELLLQLGLGLQI